MFALLGSSRAEGLAVRPLRPGRAHLILLYAQRVFPRLGRAVFSHHPHLKLRLTVSIGFTNMVR
eukprot:5460787-Amphidinium_carterae.1